MSKVYFSRKTFGFLSALRRNNNRTWFKDHQADYERHVRDPYLQFIADMQAPLAKISSHYRADSRRSGGSLFRIYRDTRFASDKTPYKTWAAARFFHERRREMAAPSFYMHIQPKDCFAGGGIWHPEPPSLKKIRDFLIDNPASWKKATQSKTFRGNFTFWGENLSRPPRGYDANHALIEDLKRKNFAAGTEFSEALACSSELMPAVVTTFKRIAPMIDYLCAALELDF
jgi:uncharacterized protein (TIGR02453 family)